VAIARNGRDTRAAAAFLEGAAVPVLSSSIDPSDRTSQNRERMASLVGELQDNLAKVHEGGGGAGQAPPLAWQAPRRERIDRLTDSGTASWR
jgi:hypothetical protein